MSLTISHARMPWVPAGGGFPFLLKDGEVVGALAVSGPGDQNDHYFGLECVEELIASRGA